MATVSEWEGQVGKVWAESHVLTDRALAGLTQQLLERLSRVEAETIVDIGCGAGELTLALASARPAAMVRGVDVSPDLVRVATQRGANLPNAAFELADAAGWDCGGNPADLIVSRHGVMFFDDPVAAFSHIRAQTRPGATMLFSCFRTPSLNPWASQVAAILDLQQPDDPHAPGPFAFADDQHVRSILTQAGWRDVDCQPVDFAFVTGMGADALDQSLAFMTRIGPAARALRDMDAGARDVAFGNLRRWVARHCDGPLAAFPAAAWLVAARSPG